MCRSHLLGFVCCICSLVDTASGKATFPELVQEVQEVVGLVFQSQPGTHKVRPVSRVEEVLSWRLQLGGKPAGSIVLSPQILHVATLSFWGLLSLQVNLKAMLHAPPAKLSLTVTSEPGGPIYQAPDGISMVVEASRSVDKPNWSITKVRTAGESQLASCLPYVAVYVSAAFRWLGRM
jgi:hypothetical protein